MLGGYLTWQGFSLSFYLCAFGGCGEPQNAALGGFLFLLGLPLVLAWPLVLAKLLGARYWWVRGIVALVLGGLATWLINWPLWAASDSVAAVPPVALASVALVAAPAPSRSAWILRSIVLVLAAGVPISWDLMFNDDAMLIGWTVLTALVVPAVGVADSLGGPSPRLGWSATSSTDRSASHEARP